MKKKPADREPVGIPGNPLTKFTCDHCHYKGHRSSLNKGQKKCPFDPSMGFKHCGLEQKHMEHKHSISEVIKEIVGIEKRLKSIEDEMTSIKTFVQHNSTNFICAVRPVLKGHFPQKYTGHQGHQTLQMDLRCIKLACNGKLPADLSKQNMEILLGQGRSKVTACGAWEKTSSVDELSSYSKPSASCIKPSASCSTSYDTTFGDEPQCDNTSSVNTFTTQSPMPYEMATGNDPRFVYGSPNYVYVPYTQQQHWGGYWNPYMYMPHTGNYVKPPVQTDDAESDSGISPSHPVPECALPKDYPVMSSPQPKD